MRMIQFLSSFLLFLLIFFFLFTITLGLPGIVLGCVAYEGWIGKWGSIVGIILMMPGLLCGVLSVAILHILPLAAFWGLIKKGRHIQGIIGIVCFLGYVGIFAAAIIGYPTLYSKWLVLPIGFLVACVVGIATWGHDEIHRARSSGRMEKCR